jgi:hypothetical protein
MSTANPTLDSGPALAIFLKALAEEGRAIIWPGPTPESTPETLAVLRQMDEIAREETGAAAPEFSPDAAVWAARRVYDLCRFLVFRDIGEPEIAAICSVSCPVAPGPEAAWSVDLTFRHLPRLSQMARQLSHGDPLVQEIKLLATAWPLSSVGIPGLKDMKLDTLAGHPALLRLYADRIVTAGESSRLGDARVDDLLRADLGLHHDLAPALATKLFPKTS